jgi:hypothetical protein
MWGFWDEQASGGLVDGWCLAGAAGWWWELLALQEQRNQHSHKPGGGGGVLPTVMVVWAAVDGCVNVAGCVV